MPSAVLSNWLWIPKRAVEGTPSEFAPEFEHKIKILDTPQGRMLQEQLAATNEMAGEEVVQEIKPNDVYTFKSWGETSKWWTFCRGDLKKVKRLTKRLGLRLKDQRVQVPWEDEVADQVELLMTPRPHQPGPLAKWEKANHGIFEADPGFGKTYIMCCRIINLKQYTLILTHTDALAEQFITRFRQGSGSEETGFTPVTNCIEVEEALGRPIVGRYKSPDKLFPVTVATWQSFANKSGRKALKKISKKFGLVMPDEAHVFAAPVAAGVVNETHAFYRHGVSATPERKDKLDNLLYDAVGPVTAKGVMPQLPLTATLISTGTRYDTPRYARQSEWSRMLTFLSKQASRNDLIVDWVEHDIEQGRTILLLSDRRQWCIDMVETLNGLDIPSRVVLGGLSSKKGIKKREKIIGEMMAGKIRVIAATQVFKLGIDIPILDTLYGTCPMANESLLKQMVGRIRRAHDGKQEPVYRYFVDDGAGRLYGCAKATHKHLVNLNANIVLVPTGKKPDQVTFGDGYGSAAAEGSLQRRKRSSLKHAASKTPQGIEKLFGELRETDRARQTERYQRRMKGRQS